MKNTHCISLVVIELEHCLELLQIIYVSNVKTYRTKRLMFVRFGFFSFGVRLVKILFFHFICSFYALHSLSHAPPNNFEKLYNFCSSHSSIFSPYSHCIADFKTLWRWCLIACYCQKVQDRETERKKHEVIWYCIILCRFIRYHFQHASCTFDNSQSFENSWNKKLDRMKDFGVVVFFLFSYV